MRFLAFLALLVLSPFKAQAGGAFYIIDPAQTHVRIAAKMCRADILMGEFRDVRGTFWFDEHDPEKSHVSVVIAAGSGTFNKEAHKGEAIADIISGEKILNAKAFPVITFKSTRVVKTSDITADVTGDMMLLGVTMPFTMEVTFHNETGLDKTGRRLASFSAYGKFRRSAHGVKYGLDRVGIRRMDDEVTVLIDVAGNRKS